MPSNMLKPALARGELHCVGATTLDEYRKNIEKDAALERRLQKVLVTEPSVEDTIAILRGLKERYEVHHGVEITDPAIVAAATLSQRYITDRQLPDKAIDLIDESASKIRLEIDSKPEEMDKLERRLIQLKIQREALKKEKDKASKQRLKDLEAEIGELERAFADLEEIWKAEKATLEGAAQVKEDLERARFELETAQRAGDLGRAFGAPVRSDPRARAAAGGGIAGGRARDDAGAQQGHRGRGGRGRLSLDGHPGLEDAGGRARETAASGRRSSVCESSASRRRSRRSATPSAAREQVCRIPTGPTARFSFSVPRASARPSSARRWRSPCSIPKRR